MLERFGRDFFRAVPTKPGVYIMSSETGRVLYVGQSRNLRARLASYKNAHPDRAPRKLIGLVHAVHRIVWQECESALHALIRENKLLRACRPKFNAINVYPQAYCFIGFRVVDQDLTLCLTTDPTMAGFDGNMYGAFKTRSVQAFAALLRLLWAMLHQPLSPHDFPCRLLHARVPRCYSFSLEAKPYSGSNVPVCQNTRRGIADRGDPLLESLAAFLEGTTAELVALLAEGLPRAEAISRFQHVWQETDLQTLTDFFQTGPKRNYDLKARHKIEDGIIPQDRLDDLLAMDRAGSSNQ
jgi:predicted GIY-YIG superfamily endonuclease